MAYNHQRPIEEQALPLSYRYFSATISAVETVVLLLASITGQLAARQKAAVAAEARPPKNAFALPVADGVPHCGAAVF